MRGSIRQRSEDSPWTVYWFTTDPGTGRRIQHSKGGFRRKEPARPPKGDSAREHLNSIIGTVQDGTWQPDAAFTVAEFLRTHWLPAKRSEGRRPTTLEQYTDVAEAWLIPHIGATAVRSLTPRSVLELQETLKTRGGRGNGPLSDRSVQISVTVLKAATAWAAANGYLQRDPLAGYKRPRGGKSRAKDIWTLAEVRRFLDFTADDRLAAAWRLFVSYGPRRGELAGLRWENVDLATGKLNIAETRVMVDGHPQPSTPKTKAGTREIKLSAEDVELLKAHRVHQLEERLRLGLGRDDKGPVFTTQLGDPVSPDWLSRRFVELAQAAELPRLSVHGLRHTAVSIMRSRGLSAEVIAATVGHSSAIVTLTVYRHLFPEETAVVGETMSAALRGNG
jgi:integrase